MKRNVKIKAIGIGTMIDQTEAEYSPSNWYGYKPVEPKDCDIERCEAAWAILLKNNKYGISKRSFTRQIQNAGYKAYDDFDMVLERFGYMLWTDGDNRMHPYRHPDGTLIEWEQPEELF